MWCAWLLCRSMEHRALRSGPIASKIKNHYEGRHLTDCSCRQHTFECVLSLFENSLLP